MKRHSIGYWQYAERVKAVELGRGREGDRATRYNGRLELFDIASDVQRESVGEQLNPIEAERGEGKGHGLRRSSIRSLRRTHLHATVSGLHNVPLGHRRHRHRHAVHREYEHLVLLFGPVLREVQRRRTE